MRFRGISTLLPRASSASISNPGVRRGALDQQGNEALRVLAALELGGDIDEGLDAADGLTVVAAEEPAFLRRTRRRPSA
jgi:hypothetical protein